ncbi:MAG: bifunctional transaldolase/phosoglucose isomerase [Blastocatellia bacterium]|nr:bifunctional transaldolase/phosoglucose isomerase [Blastocatellia bacterium]MCS7156551.1 bifunctional transaldolase/phosoglucose isomerase [Blastocatellia bacterium]MCX7751708.1 bifunctional transaldolase/phosoglucose isomerase [Blastocatellia bacterium]MDW8168809.1 bifunctional transaldolase/phosoglucose isomerase [Acidobacteriota bacterium]MDW8257477.1 bifunctional transaldolase/phosoglucose isomerase [Acidobacteriota bacterium]
MREEWFVPEALAQAVRERLAQWERDRMVERLWAGEASIWTNDGEDRWLGWLRVVEQEKARAPMYAALRESAQRAGIAHVLLLGMGGSSLAPEVFARVFPSGEGAPRLLVLDSIDPGDVRAVEAQIDLRRALVIVSSKSGTTLESNLLLEYFLARMKRALGPERAGEHFLAITDPGTPLSEIAVREGFRHCFYGLESIGGRYSALSVFGLVPAALMGVEVERLLESAQRMIRRCRPEVPIAENPGVVLGAILGESAQRGQDKITILASQSLAAFGAWLEQLLAESTGKDGKGVVPVDDEALGPPDVYGRDRVFVGFQLESDSSEERPADRLRAAGHALLERSDIASRSVVGPPILQLTLSDLYDLGGLFFLWEMVTAVLGAILGVNPFDQPDVEASKAEARALARAYEETGVLAHPEVLLRDGNLVLFADEANRRELNARAGERSLEGYLRAHLERLREGDYFALLAYVERSNAHRQQLRLIRHRVRDGRRVATSLGFGPRFLHSTGQLHKGGPNTGVFLHVIGSDAWDHAIPGRSYTFGLIKRAQAYGDFAVLARRGRRQLGVEIEGEVSAGLARLCEAIERALPGAP